mmetsp:Transcript_10322/g.26777  ORF Transcript_10322/g.26777 Transcript_10322/m.26777 type:complete len:241 (-) Transcript_10322:108-830(-)
MRSQTSSWRRRTSPKTPSTPPCAGKRSRGSCAPSSWDRPSRTRASTRCSTAFCVTCRRLLTWRIARSTWETTRSPSCSRPIQRNRSSASRSSSNRGATASSPTCASTRAKSRAATASFRWPPAKRCACPSWYGCTPTTWRRSSPPPQATSLLCSASTPLPGPRSLMARCATPSRRCTCPTPSSLSRSSLPASPRTRPTSPRRCSASSKRTPPSAPTTTRSRARRSYRAWASSTCRSTSSA